MMLPYKPQGDLGPDRMSEASAPEVKSRWVIGDIVALVEICSRNGDGDHICSSFGVVLSAPRRKWLPFGWYGGTAYGFASFQGILGYISERQRKL
jgi:hypothetical protein